MAASGVNVSAPTRTDRSQNSPASMAAMSALSFVDTGHGEPPPGVDHDDTGHGVGLGEGHRVRDEFCRSLVADIDLAHRCPPVRGLRNVDELVAVGVAGGRCRHRPGTASRRRSSVSPVADDEQGAHAVDPDTDVAADATDSRAFDLDHIGALVREQCRDVRAGQRDGDLENLDAAEGSSGHGRRALSP